MDNGRLQEIKEEWCGITDGNMPKSVEELICALEASQIAADAAKLFMDKAEEERDEARFELAKIDETRKYWLDKSENKTIIISDLREQLAASQAEVERRDSVIEVLEKNELRF